MSSPESISILRFVIKCHTSDISTNEYKFSKFGEYHKYQNNINNNNINGKNEPERERERGRCGTENSHVAL